MAMIDENEYDNEVLRSLMQRNGAMNTVQPGMEERQGVAPSQSSPTSIQAPGATDVRDEQGNVVRQAESAATSAPKKSYMDVLRQYEYGPEGLRKAEAELKEMGIQSQIDSGGRSRGRLKLANGDIVDVVAGGEGNDWWNNKTGEEWGNLNRGQEGLDAGGWSFGGGGYENPSGMAGGIGSTTDRINSLVPTDASTYNTLMQRIQGIIGPQSTDRAALMELMNR